MRPLKIFVVEDERILRVSLTDELRDAGYMVEAFEDGRRALARFQKQPADVVISDIKMPGMDGLELLEKIKQARQDTFVILITAYGSIDSAVHAMKKGAYDYITKPFKIDELLIRLQHIEDILRLRQENIRFQSEFQTQFGYQAFVGSSKAVQETLELVRTVAESKTTVLITGETGTGKELLANILHYNSDRRKKPLVKVSCAILSREVFESELFGHEKGAFTGATKARPGRFELADGGTLYLDDVDDIPLDLQVKLLRVLQEGELERVGGNETIRVDVRVVASTKAELRQLVSEGRFREDLYYRLNVFPIHLVPLRERKEDIPELVQHFIRMQAPERDIRVPDTVMQCLMNYDWPGNIRELKNIVERLILLSRGQELDPGKLPLELLQPAAVSPEVCLGQKPLEQVMADVEANMIRQALEQTGGNRSRAAGLLGIPESTLRSKMKKYNLTF